MDLQAFRMKKARTDIVAHVVRDGRGIARIVFVKTLLDFADEIRADVGRLRIDAAAESREDRDERRAEREADETADGFVRLALHHHEVENSGREQRERDDEQAGHRATVW